MAIKKFATEPAVKPLPVTVKLAPAKIGLSTVWITGVPGLGVALGVGAAVGVGLNVPVAVGFLIGVAVGVGLGVTIGVGDDAPNTSLVTNAL